MKKTSLLATLLLSMGSAYAGTYRCDVELVDGSKTKIRGVIADSEAQAARIVKENNGNVKYINCMRVD